MRRMWILERLYRVDLSVNGQAASNAPGRFALRFRAAPLETGRHDSIEELDRPPHGWFVLDVMPKESRRGDWVALMVDVHPDDLKTCTCDFPALFYVRPKEYRPGNRTARQGWLRTPVSTGIGMLPGTLLRT
jgi:hypothetical protein